MNKLVLTISVFTTFNVYGSFLAAEEWNLLSGEFPLNFEQASELTSGSTLTFSDNSQSKYSVGGAYSHSFSDGRTKFGAFDVRSDGRVCVNFRNGQNRCDLFLYSDGILLMLTEEGDRFPVNLRLKLK